MSQDIFLKLIGGIVVIGFSLIEIKLYKNRDKKNNWGLFHQAAIDLKKPFDKEGWTTGKFSLYFAIFGLIVGTLMIISMFW
jgi:hypothetical protein